MKQDKIYKSKSGKQFKIGKFSAPFHMDAVTFTQEEFDWLKSQNLKPEEFDFLWNAKKENHNYPMIPTEYIAENEKVSDKYSREIINLLKGKRDA